MRLKRKESDLKQIIAQAQGAKIRLRYSKAELENLQKKNIKCQAVWPQNYFRCNIIIEPVFFESQRILGIQRYIVLWWHRSELTVQSFTVLNLSCRMLLIVFRRFLVWIVN